MLNRLVFLYSFSIAAIIGVSVTFGYVLTLLEGWKLYIAWAAMIAFMWYVIPAPKWLIPFLKLIQARKMGKSITREEMYKAFSPEWDN